MKINKAIKILKDIQAYVDDIWDHEDNQKDIDESIEALEMAINAIKSNEIVGNLTIGDCNYIVSKNKNN